MINFFSGVSNMFSINHATLSGCMDIVCVQQPDGSFKSSPFHVRFGKLKLLKSARKQVTISVNGVESQAVGMLLGQEGEAFFLREALEGEATESIENMSSSQRPNAQGSNSGGNNNSSSLPSRSDGPKDQKGPRSGHDASEFKTGSRLEDFDIDQDEHAKAGKHNSSPKSAHNAMGPGHFDDLIDDHDQRSPQKEDFGETVEEQRKGLWRSIFGYFRGPRKTEAQPGAGAAKSEKNSAEELAARREQEEYKREKQEEREFDVNVDDMQSVGYDSEGQSSESQNLQQDSEIHMSLCLDAFKALEPTSYCEMKEIFDQCKVDYQQMCKNPQAVMKDPNLVVQIERNFYTWENGAPMIMSCLVWKKPLPPDQIGKSLNEQMLQNEQQLREQNQIDEMFEMYDSDFLEAEDGAGEKETKGEQDDDIADMIEEEPQLVTIKTLSPSSSQLESLNLQPGENVISFTVHSRLQGEQTITGKIFLWDYRTKIIISDVDGTITRSDVMGHVMPRFGHDWSHAGICNLFQKINKNGYQVLYLTARAIGQANSSRNYIMNLRQDTDLKRLPEGPLIMSPDRLLRSFNREVILRKPQVFKIACLKNILKLFPRDQQPFYCGFGNRETDAVSYMDVGVPLSKVFIINPEGEITQCEQPHYQKSYNELAQMAEEMFPTIVDPLGIIARGLVQLAQAQSPRALPCQTSRKTSQEDSSKQLAQIRKGLSAEQPSMGRATRARRAASTVELHHAQPRTSSLAQLLNTSAMQRTSNQETYNDLNYWRASGASLIHLVSDKPRKSNRNTESTGRLLSAAQPDSKASSDRQTSTLQQQLSGYDSDDMDDEEQLLEALIRSEMGDDAL